MFLRFDELYGKKLQKLFEQTTMIWHFDEVFSKKLHGSSEKPRKIISWKSTKKSKTVILQAKTHQFWNKLPCFDALVNFSAKSCRKCLVSWENSKNHRLGENLQLFGEQSTMFMRFDELFRKRGQKVPRFVKKHEKSSIWPTLGTFRTNYHVLAFRWLLQEKVAKRWKEWLIWWKMTKNHRFGLNLQLFEQTTMFRRFCQLFSKKLQKVVHFVKEHEKSSIWPKLATFRANYHVSAFWWTFQQKVSHFVKKHEKSSFGSCLAHS